MFCGEIQNFVGGLVNGSHFYAARFARRG
jgi:hypothetical protein